MAQCPTEAQLESGGTLNVPTDSDCSSPVTCDIATADFWDIDGNITLLSCATLNLTQGANFLYILGGTFTVEAGATLTSNRRLIVDGASLVVNGTLDVGDGAGVDRLVVENGGSIVVGSTGSVDVGNGSIRVGGNGGGNTGTLDVDGTLNVSGDITIQGNGTLEGSGMITFGGTFTDNGTVTGTFTNCVDGSNAASCGDTTLPVELVSFSSQLDNSNVAILNWSTASELNNEGFYVERSSDGLQFEEIGFVEGNGTTSQRVEYQYFDNSISSNTYYRLKQVDYDGQFEYSPIVYLEFDKNQLNQIGIFPNPVVSQFKFTNGLEGVFEWSVTNVSGKRLLDESNLTVAQAEIKINQLLASMQKGTYFIQFSNLDSKQSIRLLKN